VRAETSKIEDAVKGREAAEQAAHEQAFRARVEAQRPLELAASLEEARAALEVTARLVDPEPFVDALRPRRPQLGC
jgi:hypothetical protein